MADWHVTCVWKVVGTSLAWQAIRALYRKHTGQVGKLQPYKDVEVEVFPKNLYAAVRQLRRQNRAADVEDVQGHEVFLCTCMLQVYFHSACFGKCSPAMVALCSPFLLCSLFHASLPG